MVRRGLLSQSEVRVSEEAAMESFPERLGGRMGRAGVHVDGAILPAPGPGPRAGATLRADVAAAFSVGDCGARL